MNRFRNLTTRISFRCTENEFQHIHALADDYGVTVTNLLRHSIIIAIARAPTPHKWRSALDRAFTTIAERNPWSTS